MMKCTIDNTRLSVPDSVGQEFRQSTTGMACFCSLHGVWGKTRNAEGRNQLKLLHATCMVSGLGGLQGRAQPEMWTGAHTRTDSLQNGSFKVEVHVVAQSPRGKHPAPGQEWHRLL